MSAQLTTFLTLGFTLAVYVVVMYVNVLINRLEADIRSGVIGGIPESVEYRWLLLYTNFLPYTAFVIGLLLISATGLLAVAKEAQSLGVKQVVYLCAAFLGTGSAFIAILGPFHFFSCRSAIQSSRV
jgi:hypothetical protein